VRPFSYKFVQKEIEIEMNELENGIEMETERDCDLRLLYRPVKIRHFPFRDSAKNPLQQYDRDLSFLTGQQHQNPELLHRAEYAIYAEATLAVLWELIPRICYRLCVGVSIL